MSTSSTTPQPFLRASELCSASACATACFARPLAEPRSEAMMSNTRAPDLDRSINELREPYGQADSKATRMTDPVPFARNVGWTTGDS
eukprot:13411446-Alexandrium_andersonii.AAC.1